MHFAIAELLVFVVKPSQAQPTITVTTIVTVTEALVLRLPLLGDRGRITKSIRIMVPVDRLKQIFSDHDETSQSIAAFSAPSPVQARNCDILYSASVSPNCNGDDIRCLSEIQTQPEHVQYEATVSQSR